MQITAQETAITPQAHPLMSPVFPRFTPQEAIVLNMIVSANPGYVTREQVIRKLEQTLAPTFWGRPTRNSVQITICNIRAKIGERKNRPTRLISVYEIKDTGVRGVLVGYAWKG